MWLENLSSFDKEKKKKDNILSEDQMQTFYFSLTLVGLFFFF